MTKTIDEISKATGIRRSLLRELFLEDEQRGIVEQTSAGEWRLTTTAAARFGRALADLSAVTERRTP